MHDKATRHIRVFAKVSHKIQFQPQEIPIWINLNKYNEQKTIEINELQGCYTQAKTIQELMIRIREAIELCLEADK